MKIVHMKTPAQRAELNEIDSFTARLILKDIRRLYHKNKYEITELGLSETEYFQRMKSKLLDQRSLKAL